MKNIHESGFSVYLHYRKLQLPIFKQKRKEEECSECRGKYKCHKITNAVVKIKVIREKRIEHSSVHKQNINI
jgi:hypothetical protein